MKLWHWALKYHVKQQLAKDKKKEHGNKEIIELP